MLFGAFQQQKEANRIFKTSKSGLKKVIWQCEKLVMQPKKSKESRDDNHEAADWTSNVPCQVKEHTDTTWGTTWSQKYEDILHLDMGHHHKTACSGVGEHSSKRKKCLLFYVKFEHNKINFLTFYDSK